MMSDERINEFVAITMLSAIHYKSVEDLHDFAEIDDGYDFGICEDVDFWDMYLEEQEELWEKWHQKANEVFLQKREELREELELAKKARKVFLDEKKGELG